MEDDDDGENEDEEPSAEAVSDVCAAWLLAGMSWEVEAATTIIVEDDKDGDNEGEVPGAEAIADVCAPWLGAGVPGEVLESFGTEEEGEAEPAAAVEELATPLASVLMEGTTTMVEVTIAPDIDPAPDELGDGVSRG